MDNAPRIPNELDGRLRGEVEMTLYGRAAIALGFGDVRSEAEQSMVVDAVSWMGQAEDNARGIGLLGCGRCWRRNAGFAVVKVQAGG